jgi:hypothetical protein
MGQGVNTIGEVEIPIRVKKRSPDHRKRHFRHSKEQRLFRCAILRYPLKKHLKRKDYMDQARQIVGGKGVEQAPRSPES